MHWYFVIVTWFGDVGLERQEIPASPNTETECNRMRKAVVADWASQGLEVPDFGNTVSDCKFGKGQELT
jgi:hypothetical protein